MNKISMTLLRTVFLPVGSPPIGSVCEIKADIGKADIHVEGEQIYCLGEMDIIIDYLSFSANSGRHLFADQTDTYPGGGGREWQAMINLPFTLNEKADLDAKAQYTASLGDIKWFMVAPRALEMEMEILLTEQTVTTPSRVPYNINLDAQKKVADKEQKKDGGWQMVSITDVEKDMVEQSDNINTAAVPEEETLAQTATVSVEDASLTTAEVTDGGDLPVEEVLAEEASTDIDDSSTASVNDTTEDIEPMAEEAIAENIIEPEAAIVTEVPVTDTEPVIAMPEDKAEPEIVKIVFNDGPQPDEKEIEEAIAKAKAEAAKEQKSMEVATAESEPAVVDVSETEEAVETMAPVDDAAQQEVAAKPKKVRRSHGLPRLSVDAQNNNVEISAFNINIKLP